MKKQLFIVISLFLCGGVMMAKNANPDIRSGNAKYNDKEYTQAEIEYRKGIQADKQSVESYYNLGNSLYQQGKYKEAAAEFEKAAKLTDNKDKKASAYHNLGNSLYKAEDFGSSVDAYKNALKNNPKDEQTRFNLELAKQKLQQQQRNKK